MPPQVFPSNLSPADLAATASRFGDARTPPGRLFHATDIYALDLERIFGRMWVCVGHVSSAREPGQFFTVELGDESLIVVRGQDRTLRAFFNVCRHRGTRLTSNREGRCSALTCPYHGWRYGLDGSLIAAPSMDEDQNFDAARYPLVSARIEEYLGFIFVNLSDDPAPVAAEFDDLPDLSRFRFDELTCIERHEYDVASNWKLVCQNFHECYHCSVAHPDLHRISHHGNLSNADASGRLFIGGPMALRKGYTTLTRGGVSPRRPLPGATPDDRQRVHYFQLLPNLLLSIAPDYVLTHHLYPTAPERVRIDTCWLFAPEQLADADFDAADVVDFWETTNRQDWQLCENALKGLKSARHRPGPYQSSEDCAHRFDQWYVTTMFPEYV